MLGGLGGPSSRALQMLTPPLLVASTASGIGLSPTTTQVRSGRQLLRLARSLSRESDSSPLRWLEVSDATLDLVTHRTGIRLVEALEVRRLRWLSRSWLDALTCVWCRLGV